MRLSAIDIGSNSIHMIVARIDGDGNIEIIDRMREAARLGEETLETGYLSEATQERGLQALRRFKTLADAHRVDAIIACATSATRDARNGQNFLRRVQDEVGIDARIIDGTEEGRLIYLGAREAFDFGGRRAVLTDIGGGSVEFIVADRLREHMVHSLRIGVRRLNSRFLRSDPPREAEIAEMTSWVRSQIDPTVQAARRRGFELLVCTSGTASAVARMAAPLAPLAPPNVVPRATLDAVVASLLRTPSTDLARLPGWEERRRDTLVHGGLLLRILVEALDTDGYTFCDGALREGMIVDYLERNRPGLRLMEEFPEPRRRSIMATARRLLDSTAHSLNVAALATSLFDQLAPLHGLGAPEREWLEYAAILHNVGHVVAHSSHHKHSLYVIRNADLVGFTPREKLVMANVARYHRRSDPKSRHPDYMELAPDDREIVKRLAVLLRVANALDRGHQGVVTGVSCELAKRRVTLRVTSLDDPTLEVAAVRDARTSFESVFGLELEAEVIRSAAS